MKFMSRRKRKISSKYQKLLPAGTLAAFLLGSLFYVIFIFHPAIDMSINGRSPLQVHSRSQAEIEVYRELPYKASFQLSTGQSFSVDMRFLGLSYFTAEELRRLDNISAKTVWDKFTPFFDTSENLPIAVYPNRIFWLKPLEEVLTGYPNLLRQQPATNHLVMDGESAVKVADKSNGYQIEPAAFIQAAEEIAKSGKFDAVPVESQSVEAEDQAELLGQYSHYLERTEVAFPDNKTQEANMKTAFYKLQNIYLAAGETKSISDLLGDLTAESGYLPVKDKDKEVYGMGAEQIVDAIRQLAFSRMNVVSYRGQFFNIGNPAEGLTELTVQNNTDTDMVFSLSLEEGQITVILASK
ncbi:hypothetical protein ACVRXQ_05925 [Streptococcus panodentis]|uniref:Uncharacterized protein n=1 Tax=Streptococcus panodentis TaxID=1581472 RepID=A0ABS5AX49_9STRE|nr:MULTISPECIES: hypothetical protein [Streptococcus]KXT84999.1 hypothetical protein STRDD11_00601 [Streptococcus sp. DD11]MBP2620314.1 hypothetical protein [Streptococcus panodentis]